MDHARIPKIEPCARAAAGEPLCPNYSTTCSTYPAHGLAREASCEASFHADGIPNRGTVAFPETAPYHGKQCPSVLCLPDIGATTRSTRPPLLRRSHEGTAPPSPAPHRPTLAAEGITSHSSTIARHRGFVESTFFSPTKSR